MVGRMRHVFLVCCRRVLRSPLCCDGASPAVLPRLAFEEVWHAVGGCQHVFEAVKREIAGQGFRFGEAGFTVSPFWKRGAVSLVQPAVLDASAQQMVFKDGAEGRDREGRGKGGGVWCSSLFVPYGWPNCPNAPFAPFWPLASSFA